MNTRQLLLCLVAVLLATGGMVGQSAFTPEQVRDYPFPYSLTVSDQGQKLAWIVHHRGQRNVYVAEGPDFVPRPLTNFSEDDGQEITSLSISPDGQWVVFLRGGEHGSNWDDERTINPQSLPKPPSVSMYSIPYAGGAVTELGAGAQPVIHPDSKSVTFEKSGQLWSIPIDGSGEAQQLIELRGRNHSPVWSPDGRRMAFVSSRGRLAYIGIYSGPEEPVVWADPDFNRDYGPRWSPDGKQLVYVRRPGGGGPPDPILEATHSPWSLCVFDMLTQKSERLWTAPETLAGSHPRSQGGTNLHWVGDHIVFLSYHDGWPHLYAMQPGDQEARLLTDGPYMAEYISAAPDGRSLLFGANTGPDPLDVDRRHLVEVEVATGKMQMLTAGDGLEWTPVRTGNGAYTAFISATAQRPPMVAVMGKGSRDWDLVGANMLPKSYPADDLVVPQQVTFSAPDGLTIHASKFEREDMPGPKPAVIYIHGGPPRQMLLGWHYSDYYSNAYAMNQYLASQGFVVLSVNYRLGIGYGFDFQNPPNAGWRGAAEYQDIVAAGEWLAKQSEVDPDRIGVYGGSYGGYLTAMALGRDSRLFAAGVDIHGVHDRTMGRMDNWLVPQQYETAPDIDRVPAIAWRSSPSSWVDQWTSPVLVIHGDDDRNVNVDHSTDLVERLREKGVPHETLLIVDDSHHWMRYANQLRVNAATVDFLKRHLLKK